MPSPVVIRSGMYVSPDMTYEIDQSIPSWREYSKYLFFDIAENIEYTIDRVAIDSNFVLPKEYLI